MYCIGGLEPSESDRAVTFTIGGTEYLLTDKFKTMLRDAFIDWGTFLEVYDQEINHNNMFDQIIKLLNIKENKNLREQMLPLLKTIHKLPAKSHITCMMKQFMIYEPVSIAIQSVFSDLKYHYEAIVHKFVEVRNAYIDKNQLRVKPNDWDKLISKWTIDNDRNDYESSSIILLMLNPPKKIKHRMHTKVPGMEAVISKLNAGIKAFHYPGFCPKVPHTRLVKLLKFPINEFASAILALDDTVVLPDYKSIEKSVIQLLTRDSPPDVENKPHNKPPADLTKDTSEAGQLNLIKWYVSDILEYRKGLLDAGRKYEQYYIDMAKKLARVHNVFKQLTIS